jgi:hypothetical protein
MTQLIIRGNDPFNAEPPVDALLESGYITIQELVGPTILPKLDQALHCVS